MKPGGVLTTELNHKTRRVIYNIYQLTAQREQIVQDKEFNLNDRYLRILDLILYKRSYELKNKIIIVVNLNTY